MNPMDQLRAARPVHLDDAPVDARTRAAELSAAMAGRAPRRAAGRTRRARDGRPAWVLGGLAAAAAATAVAVAVAGAGGSAPAPSLALPAPSTSSGGPVVRLSAEQVLLAAAESSLKAPATTGAYWYVESEDGSAYEAGDAVRYIVHSTGRGRTWVARSPRGTSWWVSQDLGTRPAPGAEDAWKRDGSPSRWTVELPVPKKGDKSATKRLELGGEPRKPFGNPINVGDKVADLAGRNVSVAELQALPTTADALKRRLLQGYAGHGTESGDKMDADSWLYQVTSGLLSDMPVKPAVRAAAYKVLAGLGGVRSLGEVTDALGREGQGIARAENWSGGDFERQIIIDPATGVLLTDQIVAVHPGGAYAWAEPGTATWWHAITKAGWTDDEPVKPDHYDTPGPARPSAS
ncbi:CU044_5270 family protein [Sphaerisporangium rhizosphaerae]|uniref:CU044_5270 family protein n=1 Tax=Sphaerisporangium rhizosphaerae TaxID=2269375 RepID=A0ABW2P467_9ACTN